MYLSSNNHHSSEQPSWHFNPTTQTAPLSPPNSSEMNNRAIVSNIPPSPPVHHAYEVSPPTKQQCPPLDPSYIRYRQQHMEQQRHHQQHPPQQQYQSCGFYNNSIVLSPVSHKQQQQQQQLSSESSPQPMGHRRTPSSEMAAIVKPPCWAVPARGDSRLEPIGDTTYTHTSIDLSTRPYFRIGRSPSSDVPLLHNTSSRRHALIFHHASGACYVTDCFSAHGTFVDGVRVPTYPGLKRIRRGSLLRLGGEGSPTFVLKNFSVRLGDMVRDLEGVARSFEESKDRTPTDDDEEEETTTATSESKTEAYYFRHARQWIRHSRQRDSSTTTTTTPSNRRDDDVLACIRGDGGGVACIADGRDAPTAALVLLNTRLNALGPEGLRCRRRARIAENARGMFAALATAAGGGTTSGRKRSREEMREDVPCGRGPKPILVTDDNRRRIRRRVRSSSVDEPVVHRIQDSMGGNLPSHLTLPFTRPKRQRTIRFDDEAPPTATLDVSVVLPPVSPDNSLDDGSDEEQQQQQQRRHAHLSYPLSGPFSYSLTARSDKDDDDRQLILITP